MTTEDQTRAGAGAKKTAMWTEDRAARELLTFPRVVAGIVTELLPETAARFDFDKMKIFPTVTLDSSGGERTADTSWEIALEDGDAVGVLIEWQSTPDSKMLLRMSEYATRLATLMARQSSRRYPDGSTPYVFLIVIYTGGPRSSWNAPTEWRLIVVKRWPESEIAKRLAHIDTWRDVRSIGTEQKRMELEMTLTTFEREIAELKAEGRREGHELGLAKGRQLGMTDSLRRLVKRKYGQSAWERVSAFMQAAPSASVTPEMFDWLLECSSVEEFMGRMGASNGASPPPVAIRP